MKQARQKDITVVPFHVVAQKTCSSNVAVQELNPGAGWSARLAAIAEGYSLYRITKLKFRQCVNGTSSGVSYVADVADAGSVSPNFFNNNYSCFMASVQTVPSEWINVPRSILKGALDWYKSLGGTATTWEEVNGSLYFWSSGATDVIRYELRGVMEFKGPVDPAQVPRLRERHAQALQRTQNLNLLADSFATRLSTTPKREDAGIGVDKLPVPKPGG